MSGGIIFQQGSPVAWIAAHQERTLLRSCEAEICAHNEVSKLLMSIHNLAESVRNNGLNILDTTTALPLYNNNESCVRWFTI